MVLTVLLAAASVAVTSPDGHNEIVLSRQADGSAAWSVSRDGKPVLAPAAIGLDLSPAPKSVEGDHVVRFQKSGAEPTPIYKKGVIDHASNWASVGIAEGVKVELVARNDGVAWRFVLNGRPDERIDVVRETADVRFADRASTLYAGVIEHGAAKASYWTSADPLQHSSETPFVKTTPDALMAGRTNAVAYLPLTGRTASGTWFAVKDTDVRDYPGWQLQRAERDFRGVFAAEPDPGLCFRTGVFCRVTARLGRLANVSRRRTLPWRCVLLADTPGGLAEADALYALAEGPKGDFSWVKPGLCVWDWWCAHNIPDAPGLKPNSTEEYCHYIDFAAANGIPYFLIDGGWLQNNDLNRPRPGVDLPKTFAYAKQKGVKVIVWCAWVSLLEDLEHSMARFAAMGCSGFKIDFLDRDDVLASRFMWRAAAAAAEKRLVIDFHGCPVPNGLQRTYPNVLNFEAVRGLENAKWDEAVRDFPPHDVRLVFTRFLAGPADYTPGAFLHRTREGYVPTPKRPCVPGTRVHQMALYTLYEAPLQMLCDSPTQYRASPGCLKFLAGTPAAWDETRVLAGSPDDFAVMARRRGEVWQVGAITDWTARELELDTSFLGDGQWTLESFADASDADMAPEGFVRSQRTVSSGERLRLKLAPGGGWTGRFTRLSKRVPEETLVLGNDSQGT